MPTNNKIFDKVLVIQCILISSALVMSCRDHSIQANSHQNLSRAVCLSVNPTTETLFSTPCDAFEHLFSSILKKRELLNKDTLILLNNQLSNLKFDTSTKELDNRPKIYLYSNSDTTVVCLDVFGNILLNGKLANEEKAVYKLLTDIAGWSQ